MILRHVSFFLDVPQEALHKIIVYKTKMNCQIIKTADSELAQDTHHYRNIKDKLYKTNVSYSKF
jgi:hypothetical protein